MHVVFAVCVQTAVHIAADPLIVAVSQGPVDVQLIGQLPSQVSPISTIMLPQVATGSH
jgi:hypothetical protein